MTDIDWSLFRFPPPPPKRWGRDGADEVSSPGPKWAAPPIKIVSWHFDDETWTIVHPVQRKKIDLHRVTSKRRLTKLAEMISAQALPLDISSLWLALNEATTTAFGMSLPQMLAFGPNDWSWPTLDLDAPIDDLKLKQS